MGKLRLRKSRSWMAPLAFSQSNIFAIRGSLLASVFAAAIMTSLNGPALAQEKSAPQAATIMKINEWRLTCWHKGYPATHCDIERTFANNCYIIANFSEESIIIRAKDNQRKYLKKEIINNNTLRSSLKYRLIIERFLKISSDCGVDPEENIGDEDVIWLVTSILQNAN